MTTQHRPSRQSRTGSPAHRMLPALLRCALPGALLLLFAFVAGGCGGRSSSATAGHGTDSTLGAKVGADGTPPAEDLTLMVDEQAQVADGPVGAGQLGSGTGQPGAANSSTAQSRGSRLALPAIPATLTDPTQRTEYLLTHYWDNYDFADTTLISNADYTEQAFVDFIYLLPNAPKIVVRKAINTLIGKAAAVPAMFYHFTELAESYLYDPNSPMRNEGLYIPVLEAVIALPGLDDVNKIRPRHQLTMARKNRPGTVAADFMYTTERPASGSQRHTATSDGKATASQARIRTTGRLSGIKGDYTLLFFYDPDCPDCKRVKQYIASSPVFGELIGGNKGGTGADGNTKPASGSDGKVSDHNGNAQVSGSAGGNRNVSGGKYLTVLAVYTDADLDAWRKHLPEIPQSWTVGYDKGTVLRDKELYDLRAIPTLYLLDKEKRVLLKDATVEQVELWLAEHE